MASKVLVILVMDSSNGNTPLTVSCGGFLATAVPGFILLSVRGLRGVLPAVLLPVGAVVGLFVSAVAPDVLGLGVVAPGGLSLGKMFNDLQSGLGMS